MKKIQYVLWAMVIGILFASGVHAEVQSETLKSACTDESLECSSYTESSDTSLPNIYVFRGAGCGYCAKLLTYLSQEMSNGYANKVNVVVYEVTKNTDNMSLYTSVAAKFGDEVSGYPYMVIGKKVFDGYASSYDSQITDALDELVNSSDKYDVVKEVNEGNTDRVDTVTAANDNSKVAFIVIFIMAVVILLGGYFILKKKED